MPPFASQLNDEEVAAVANHERTSWGNDASEITAEDVKKVRDYVMEMNQ
jgi:cytochrome c oxidase cbb3-type subunit 2